MLGKTKTFEEVNCGCCQLDSRAAVLEEEGPAVRPRPDGKAPGVSQGPGREGQVSRRRQGRKGRGREGDT